MLLGFAAFAGLPFSTGGPPVTYVSVTGNALTLGTGTVIATGGAIVSVSGNSLVISIGSATITGSATVVPTGAALTLATGEIGAITWSEIQPAATMTWTPIDPT
tara:strand:- start:230 stop:541 length:312 start_codon:yes stop_codon:yes gene_type:complete